MCILLYTVCFVHWTMFDSPLAFEIFFECVMETKYCTGIGVQLLLIILITPLARASIMYSICEEEAIVNTLINPIVLLCWRSMSVKLLISSFLLRTKLCNEKLGGHVLTCTWQRTESYVENLDRFLYILAGAQTPQNDNMKIN